MNDPASRTLVMKFGGTSVGSPAAMSQMAEIIRDARRDWPRVVVVVSALTGVTDLLLKQAGLAANGDVSGLHGAVAELQRRHAEIVDALALDERRADVKAEVDGLIAEFEVLCRAVAVLGEASPRAHGCDCFLGRTPVGPPGRRSCDCPGAAGRGGGCDAVGGDERPVHIGGAGSGGDHPENPPGAAAAAGRMGLCRW